MNVQAMIDSIYIDRFISLVYCEPCPCRNYGIYVFARVHGEGMVAIFCKHKSGEFKFPDTAMHFSSD